MKAIIEKCKNWILNTEGSIRYCLFKMVIAVAVIGCGVSTVVTLLNQQWVSVVLSLLCGVFLVILSQYCDKTGQYERGGTIILFGVTLVLFPIMYLNSGAMESGMPSWFLLGLVFTFIILEGRRFCIFLVVEILVELAVIYISYQRPELIHGEMERSGFYVDALQSYLLVALVVGAVIKFQVMVYEKSKKLTEEQNFMLEKQAKELEVQKEQLQEAGEAAEQANRAKSDFIASMSHEIRTPINAVMGLSEMILRESKDSEITGHAVELVNSAELLQSLINDILDFSKIESRKMEIIPIEYESVRLIGNLEKVVADRAKKKGLKLSVHVDPALPVKLYGDDTRVKQVLLNLLTNAVKYTEKGQVELSVTVLEKKDDYVNLKFVVRDTGIGIRREDLDRLFDSFVRLDQTKNRNIEGTGLGLAITKSFVELMDGRLSVESEYGQGSAFTILLKQKIVDGTPIGEYEKAASQDAKKRSDYNVSFTAPDAQILVVDDNRVNRAVFAGLLKHTKIKIDQAASGMECLEMSSGKRYDIIFMDHMMPEMDGLETFIKLREDSDGVNAATPVIALTANALAETRKLFMDTGFQDYMTKPVKGEQLETMIRSYLPEEKIV